MTLSAYKLVVLPTHVGADPPIVPTPSHWGLITAADVQVEQQRTLASAKATDASVSACTTLPPSAKAGWAAFLAGLTTWCTTPIVNFWTPWQPANAVVVTGDTGETMMAWEAQLKQWQQVLATACQQTTPAGAPPVFFPPDILQLPGSSPPPEPSWLCSTLGIGCEGSWADAVRWVAILGVLGLGAWYAGPLIVTAVGAASGAIQRLGARR